MTLAVAEALNPNKPNQTKPDCKKAEQITEAYWFLYLNQEFLQVKENVYFYILKTIFEKVTVLLLRMSRN